MSSVSNFPSYPHLSMYFDRCTALIRCTIKMVNEIANPIPETTKTINKGLSSVIITAKEL